MALRPTLCLAVGLAAAPVCAPAQAAVWTARDLGTIATEAACVEMAVKVFETYANLFGGSDLRRGAWLVALDDLGHGGMDGLISCTHAAAETRATLVIHSAADSAARLVAADRLAGFWRSFAQEGPRPPRP